MNEMMKETIEEEKKVEDCVGQVMLDRVESLVYDSPSFTPWKFVSPLMESVMESTAVGPADEVITAPISEMNDNSVYSSMSNDHECIDPPNWIPALNWETTYLWNH